MSPLPCVPFSESRRSDPPERVPKTGPGEVLVFGFG